MNENDQDFDRAEIQRAFDAFNALFRGKDPKMAKDQAKPRRTKAFKPNESPDLGLEEIVYIGSLAAVLSSQDQQWLPCLGCGHKKLSNAEKARNMGKTGTLVSATQRPGEPPVCRTCGTAMQYEAIARETLKT